MKSRYKLSDKVRKNRIRDWLCLIAQVTVFVVVFAIGLFRPQVEPLGLGLVGFALCTLIEIFKGLEEIGGKMKPCATTLCENCKYEPCDIKELGLVPKKNHR